MRNSIWKSFDESPRWTSYFFCCLPACLLSLNCIYHSWLLSCALFLSSIKTIILIYQNGFWFDWLSFYQIDSVFVHFIALLLPSSTHTHTLHLFADSVGIRDLLIWLLHFFSRFCRSHSAICNWNAHKLLPANDSKWHRKWGKKHTINATGFANDVIRTIMTYDGINIRYVCMSSIRCFESTAKPPNQQQFAACLIIYGTAQANIQKNHMENQFVCFFLLKIEHTCDYYHESPWHISQLHAIA